MKTFYSAQDIESFAEQGQREIRIDENVVLTDLAKQTANMLGIRIVKDLSGASPDNLTSAYHQLKGQSPALRGKPKGCQRRPQGKPAPPSRASANQSRPVVDKLVEKIRRVRGRKG